MRTLIAMSILIIVSEIETTYHWNIVTVNNPGAILLFIVAIVLCFAQDIKELSR
jgi:hypothetical protein